MVDTLSTIEPGDFDVIMLLGVFYHTTHHFKILSELKRCRPRYVVMDTFTSKRDEPLIMFKLERHAGLGASIATSELDTQSVVGIPSPAWIDMACRNLGFSYYTVDWQRLGITDWDRCNDYENGTRLTYILWADREPGEKTPSYLDT